jgi:hypothetical protein
MNLKAQGDLSITGDAVGRDKITINLTRGLDELPTRYDSRVQNFLEYYLGDKNNVPAPRETPRAIGDTTQWWS